VPKLSEERRKDLCKVVKKYGEDKRVSLRNLRKDANEEAKKLKGTVSEDQIKQTENDIQKTTDKYNTEIDKLVEEKGKLLLTY
jgi:ribosome recycling factor